MGRRSICSVIGRCTSKNNTLHTCICVQQTDMWCIGLWFTHVCRFIFPRRASPVSRSTAASPGRTRLGADWQRRRAGAQWPAFSLRQVPYRRSDEKQVTWRGHSRLACPAGPRDRAESTRRESSRDWPACCAPKVSWRKTGIQGHCSWHSHVPEYSGWAAHWWGRPLMRFITANWACASSQRNWRKQ